MYILIANATKAGIFALNVTILATYPVKSSHWASFDASRSPQIFKPFQPIRPAGLPCLPDARTTAGHYTCKYLTPLFVLNAGELI